MTSWSPQRRIALAAMLGLASLGAAATPASALPLIGVGANVGAGVHIPSSGPLASDVTADLAVMGPVIGLQWWRTFDGVNTYLQGGVRWNVSPVPMVNVAPGVSAASFNGGLGGLGTLDASFSPLMLPASLNAGVGYGWVNGSTLLPYHVGVKLSLIPFTAINVGYRGWQGGPNVGGPEIGIEVGL